MSLTRPTFNVDNIQGLGDIVQNQKATVKALFDKTGADTKDYLISLLDEIEIDFATKEEVAGIILGQIIDGALTDDKLSDATDQIKTRFANHLIAYVAFVATKGQSNGLATLDSSGNLVQKPYVAGLYTGDNLASRSISLGFRPSAVLIIPYRNDAYVKGVPIDCYSANEFSGYTYGYIYGGSFIDGASTLSQLISYSVTVTTTPLTITDNGFTVYKEEIAAVHVPETGDYLDIISVTNSSDYSYRYVAWQ